MRRKNVIATMVVTTVGLFALPFAGTASAVPLTTVPTPAKQSTAAEVYCDGASCQGLDPAVARSSIDGYPCTAGAHTPAGAQVSTPHGRVELRYSPHCHSNWAHISGSTPGTRFWVQNWNNAVQEQYVAPGQSSANTAMVNGFAKARAGLASGYTQWY